MNTEIEKAVVLNEDMVDRLVVLLVDHVFDDLIIETLGEEKANMLWLGEMNR